MRRFYIVPRRVWQEPIAYFGEQLMLPRFNLFDRSIGSACIPLHDELELDHPEQYFLVSTDFDSARAEDHWHSHSEVARLSHPTDEKRVKLSELHQGSEYSHKNFKKHHWDRLAKKFALDETHTVWDLHDRARALDPDCRLSNSY
jgi:hypothetical protein